MEVSQPRQEFPDAATPALGRSHEDWFSAVSRYAHERPDVIAVWAFGLSFVLGVRVRFG